MAFFELRTYTCYPGKRDELIKMMDEEVIPFQVSQGMIVIGSFFSEQDENVYIWIRRFESEEERVAIYKQVYEHPTWTGTYLPRIQTLLDRSKHVVVRMIPTTNSIIR